MKKLLLIMFCLLPSEVVAGVVGSVTGAVGSVTGLTASDVGAINTKTPGMSECDCSAAAASFDIEPNNADRIRLNGVGLSDSDKLTSPGAAGDYICLLYDSADGWTTLGRSGTWVDGN